MIPKKKRTASSHVSEKLWKSVNNSKMERQKINLVNLCFTTTDKQSAPGTEQIAHSALSIVNLYENKDFTFQSLNIQPPLNAPMIIKKQDLLISRGPAKQVTQISQSCVSNLNVEVPIVSDLYKFKKRIVSSKQIEKKIENNEYLVNLLNRKKEHENTPAMAKESLMKNRLRSALPRQPISTNSDAIRPYSGISTEINLRRDINGFVKRPAFEYNPGYAKPVLTCNIEVVQQNDQFHEVNDISKNISQESTSNYKYKIRFNEKPTNASQIRFNLAPYENKKQISSAIYAPKPQSSLISSYIHSGAHEGKNKRPVTCINDSYNTQSYLKVQGSSKYSYKNRPISSITPILEARAIFSAVSHSPSEDPTSSTLQNLHPIFDFSENTIFVSMLFKDNTDYIRPSDRIGFYMQNTQSLRSEHVAYISTLKRGTHFDSKALYQIPIQFSELEVFNEIHQTRDKGICYYIDFKKMLETASYSIFPEFISTEFVEKEGIQTARVAAVEENERRFNNRDMYFRNILKRMKGTYDPCILLDDYYRKRRNQGMSMGPSAIASHQIAAESSYERYHMYCGDKFIPKSKIPPFNRNWVMMILKYFPEKILKENELKFKIFFKEIFDDYVHSQRRGIMRYLLRSEKERKRLGIFYLPEEQEMSSIEIITRSGGYHQRIFKSWNDTFVKCGRILNRQERLLNSKTLAFNNWLSEFEGISLVESKFVTKAFEKDIVSNIHGYIKFQIAYLGMFEIFGENIFKRGIVTLLDGNFYLKPSNFSLYGQFSLFEFKSLLEKSGKSGLLHYSSVEDCIDDVLNTTGNKDSANFVDIYSKVWKKMRPLLGKQFFTNCIENDKATALDFYGLPCDPKSILQSYNPYSRDPNTESLIRVICLRLEDFIVERVVSSLESFYSLLTSKIISLKTNVAEGMNQSIINLELKFEDGVFCFDDNWESISMLIELYFEKIFDSFDFIYDIFDYTAVVVSNETDRKPRLKKRPVSSEGVKTDQNDFLKEVSNVYTQYMPEIVLELKTKDEEDIVAETEQVHIDNRSRFLDKSKINQRLKEQTSDLRNNIVTLFEEQYKESMKICKDFIKFQPVLSRSFETNEFPEFMKNQKSHVLAFSSLIMQKNKNTNAADMSLVTDKLKNEEVLDMKNKLSNLINHIGTISPTRYQPIFRIRCSSVIASITLYLREIDERLCKRVVERVILNIKTFLSRYQRLTDILRKEIVNSADYAWLRSFSVEVNQERQILIRRTKEIFENFDFYLKMKSAKVNGTEVLELLFELSMADKILEEEMENSLERGYMRKVEFECKLKDEKVVFQAECAELLDEVQILRTINDIRNSTQYYEEVEHLSVKLEKLKTDFQSIDRQEIDIYERSYKTSLFDELDDLVLNNLEVWKTVSQGLSFIKKTNMVHVCQLKIEPIEEFLLEVENQTTDLMNQKDIWTKENLKIILTDFKIELDEFSSNIDTIRLICTKELRTVHWKDYFTSLVTDLEFQFLNLKIFLSLYNDDNKGGFEELCQRAKTEDKIQRHFNEIVQKFKHISFKVSSNENEMFIENYSSIMESLHEVQKNQYEIGQMPGIEFAQEEIDIFAQKISNILNLLPFILKIQEKLDFFKNIFNQIEFSIEIEKEHRAFMTALGFNQYLRDLFRDSSIEVIDQEPEFADKVKLNLSRLEIIENHPNQALFQPPVDQD
jgi:hypothetical protein